MASYTRKLIKILREDGFYSLRPGKGDHEIWRNDQKDVEVAVDSKITSRHTANGILKQAGLGKAF
jgi:predicted RNA binding protein YcfA (HicA-like mRNA interferase family)